MVIKVIMRLITMSFNYICIQNLIYSRIYFILDPYALDSVHQITTSIKSYKIKLTITKRVIIITKLQYSALIQMDAMNSTDINIQGNVI